MEVVISNLIEAESERILYFCLDLGADEFTVSFVLITDDSEGKALGKSFFDSLLPYYIGKKKLEHTVLSLESPTSPIDWNMEVACWDFTHDSLNAILKSYSGSIMYYPGFNCPEDLIIYRGETLLFGSVSHEQYAFLRLTSKEYEQFEKLGIKHVINNRK
jgi:hypothetical protein